MKYLAPYVFRQEDVNLSGNFVIYNIRYQKNKCMLVSVILFYMFEIEQCDNMYYGI